jgi:hypothetical protein
MACAGRERHADAALAITVIRWTASHLAGGEAGPVAKASHAGRDVREIWEIP